MPLSEYEQRVLDQLEQDLGQDPSLHRAMSRGPRTPARVIGAIAGVVVGLTVVVVGVMTQLPIVGILGFAIMVGVALWALLAPRKKPVPVSKDAPRPASSASQRQRSARKPFMQRMEERFERRRENGDF
ncbi:DUF3040 domain-containing protein [Demequina sp. NBRC 110053]|uniref:DUF3040 domain-containing protein n=1 Tax=Demequina sp. NBRC 110053 TaxID=1570342 RepID=UPI0009FC3642|nr:DUF3040 domain-containing protein [Demequina sp. NBRC 110053]